MEFATPESDVGIEGGVVSVTGKAVTLTVADLVSVPPSPLQERVKVASVVKEVVVKEPEVALVPVHDPLAVQEVALSDDQTRVVV